MIGLRRTALLCSIALLACGDDDEATPSAGRGGSAADGGGPAAGSGKPAAGRGGEAGRSGAPAAGRGGASTAGRAADGTGGASAVGGSGPGARLGDCPAFPPSDAWNTPVESAPVSAEWTTKLHNLVGSKKLHPDYGNSGDEHYGIPINPVPSSQAELPVQFDTYPDESDPGPYPFPGAETAIIEGGTPRDCDGDCHLIAVRAGECRLFEGYACLYHEDGWHCANGAVWDLNRHSAGQRTEGWTSADAAGLPIAPGLVRYDEAQAGQIDHAIRFTVRCTRDNYVDPASHSAVPGGCSSPDAPPMGLRVRLKADYDLSKLNGAPKAVARAMQRYGMILADNGSDFYFQGERDLRWSEDDVEPLKDIPTDAFEALEPGPLERSD
jgi:hypothetical protein